MPTVDNHPLYAHDNFIDTVFANEGSVFGTINGTQEEVESLSSGRRERNPTPWKPGTGTNRYIEVDLGSGITKAANLLWIGNGHNYGSETVNVRHATKTATFNPVATVCAVSDGADTRTITVKGQDSTGATVSDTIVLAGAAEVCTTQTYAFFDEATVASDATRTITLREGASGPTIGTIAPLATSFEIYTQLFTAVVDTGGKTLDDGAWAFVFEGTELSRRFWLIELANAGAVDVNIPALWLGRFEQLTEYWPAPIDEFGGTVHRTGVNVSDRGVRSAAVASRLVHRLNVQIEDTDATASEFVNKIEPWLDTLALGALTLVVPDWPNAGERMRLYQLESDRLAAPFTVRGRHKPQFELVEIL